METPKLNRVVRLDSIKLDSTYFTEEGYLIDHPILTTVGIFEYTNKDGSIRRELRLPEFVFEPESLSSYQGKPVIISHDAGEVTKENVSQEEIGTILSEGYQDGDNVRAKIVIHDTDELKRCGMKELSLGYMLSLDETPGVWNGKPYDAIQKGIRINHLAVVANARAGEQARLNIDSKDKKTKGDSLMKKSTRKDSGPMTPEDFAAAIEGYKARKANRINGKAAKTDESIEGAAVSPEALPVEEKKEVVDKLQLVKDRRDRRDQSDEPKTTDEAIGVIAQQDEDIDSLIEYIEELQAKSDFDSAEPVPPVEENDEDVNKDEDGNKSLAMNADSIDAIVKERVSLVRIGDKLNLDGLDTMDIMAAKKAIINKIKPNMRLDGKGKTYINAAFDLALGEIDSVKDTNYQRKQMFNKDGFKLPESGKTSAEKAREKMLERQNGGK